MLKVFLDLNCPYSYILHERLLTYADYDAIQWHYVEHLPAIETHSANQTAQEKLKVDLEYIQQHESDIAIESPEYYVNSRLATLSLLTIEKEHPEKAQAYRSYLFRSYWQFGVDISRFEALQAILASLSLRWLDYDNHIEQTQLDSQQLWQQGNYAQHLPVVVRDDEQALLGLPEQDEFLAFLGGENIGQRLANGCDFAGEFKIAAVEIPETNRVLFDGTFGFSTDNFESVEQLSSADNSHEHDAIILNFDVDNPLRHTNLTQITEFKRHDLDFPIFCWLQKNDAALETLALNLGATDILLADEAATLQLTRIKKRINTHKAINLLSKHAYVDGMTGLFNKRSFDLSLYREWRIAARNQQPLSLIILDFDYFKLYNDQFGHCAGDDCLKQLATVIKKQTFRPSDIAARFGGEEFVVLLPHTSLNNALMVANRIRQAIEAVAIPHPGNKASNVVTVSVGVATANNMTSAKPGMLTEMADKALYQAKENGRNQVKGLLLTTPENKLDTTKNTR